MLTDLEIVVEALNQPGYTHLAKRIKRLQRERAKELRRIEYEKAAVTVSNQAFEEGACSPYFPYSPYSPYSPETPPSPKRT